MRLTSTVRTTTAAVAAAALSIGVLAASVTSSAAAGGPLELLADFEAGSPPDFFVYQGGASAVSAVPATVSAGDPTARPGQQGDNGILSVDFSVGDFGGFGQDLAPGGPDDWTSFGAVDMWFLGTGSGLSYQVEIADNRSDPATDSAERFDYTFTDSSAGWRRLTIPFADFTRATDFQPPGAPDDGLGLTEVWSWAVVLPAGSDVVAFDDIALGYQVVDDFESPLPSGSDQGVSTGFSTFQGAGATIAIDRSQTAPDPPAAAGPNAVLQLDVDSSSYAGFVHAFSDDTGAWVTQDWSLSAGLRLWFYGEGSGSSMFVDLLDNRNPGSTVDDAERWTTEFVDDVAGWRLLELPFSGLTRKEVGNGAPNDGLGLDAVHGYAVGVLGTGGPRTFYVDDVALYGVGEVPPLQVRFARTNQRVEEGATGDVTVSLSRPLGDADPDEVSVGFRTEEEGSIAIADREYTPTSGTLTFVKGGSSEQSFPLQTFDDTKWEGDERIVVRLVDFDGVLPGGPSDTSVQGSVFIADNDPLDALLVDDFERGAFLWDGDGVSLAAPDVALTDAAARPDQDDVEALLEVSTPIAVDIEVKGKRKSKGRTHHCRGNGVVTVAVLSTAAFDATDIDHTTVRYGKAAETHRWGRKRTPARHVADVNRDGLPDLVFHFRAREIDNGCHGGQATLTGELRDGTPIVAGGDPATFGRDFALDQDWSQRAGLSFWYDGDGSGDEVVVTLKDNRAPDPGPDGWDLAWSQEFDAAAGTPPDPEVWNYEIGDVTPDGKNGWGNDELEFYTDDPANAAMDGDGHLAVTLDAADGSRECYYGPCEYTSARLTSWNKAEFAYGRIESRIKVPGGTGIWPAFWSLGTDIDVVQWPQTGEIDFMEYVGRLPDEIFGTIHGPGYAGGESYGGIYDFGAPVADDFHTYTVEWEPDLIRWYVDGTLYHQAEPADVSPREWVFNDPVFLLLNVAVGGNFGGPVGEDLTTPSSMLVDYVRVYQGPDTAERFEASFTDSEPGWRRVTVPFDAFVRSDEQPPGAPEDGLGLDEVWGYGLRIPEGGTSSGTLRLDQVRLDRRPKPAEVEVTSSANSGPGSLREALEEVAEGGTITFDPSLAGSTVRLQGPLTPAYDVTIDAGAAADVTLDGAGDRVLVVPPGVSVTGRHLVLTGGYGYQLGGGVLNNGSLVLDHSTVTGNTTTTDAGDFWQGGGGIYSGDGASLTLVDSTVSDNAADWSGGGIYSFLNTTTRLVRSTVSGNVSGDVGGGLRTLGALEVENSTISGNTATGWHGGGLFVTDGVAVMHSSTVTDNTAPAGTAGGLFVGTFGDSAASLESVNSIVAGNSGDQCLLAPFGAGAVALTSGGGNVIGDGTCAAGPDDVQAGDAGLGPLADNGGPTWTHALLAGSAAIDAALAAEAPATDQRGVARPQGAGPDSGAFERE